MGRRPPPACGVVWKRSAKCTSYHFIENSLNIEEILLAKSKIFSEFEIKVS
jgi:hypothetical protein